MELDNTWRNQEVGAVLLKRHLLQRLQRLRLAGLANNGLNLCPCWQFGIVAATAMSSDDSDGLQRLAHDGLRQ